MNDLPDNNLPSSNDPEPTSAPQEPANPPLTPPTPPIPEEITSVGINNLPSAKSTKKNKILLGILAFLFILVSTPLAVYLVKQRQEIRKEAVQAQTCSAEAPGVANDWCVSQHAGETKENATWSCEPGSPDSDKNDGCLQICPSGYVWEMPGYTRCIPSEVPSGTLVCRRDSNTSITLINNTSQDIAYEVIEFRGCPHTSSQCQGDEYKTKYAQPTVFNGQSKAEPMNPAHCETVQLDVKSLNGSFPCKTPDGGDWAGGVAFTIDSHWDEGCEIPTSTPSPSLTPPPGALSCLLERLLPLADLEIGDAVILSCIGEGDSIAYYDFQVSIDSGNWQSLGTTLGQLDYTILGYGCYNFECRPCTGDPANPDPENDCTNWP